MVPAATRLQIKARRRGGGSRNDRVRTEPRKDYPKVFTVTIEIMRSEKGGKPDGVQGGINGLAEWV